MLKLSAVIITYNEGKNIAHCIESVKDVADEIIVVDSFSTDSTKEICLKHNVRFFERAWDGYGDQKNWANTQASYDYILSVDADEFLSEELRKSILEIKKNGTHDAYRFNRLNIYCGKKIRHGSWYPDTKLRIWNRQMGRWNSALVHELVEMDERARVAHIKGDLLHKTYSSIDQHIRQVEVYANLWLQQALKDGKKCSLAKLIAIVPFRFTRDYFFKLGILDGRFGFIISALISYESFIKYVKLYQYTRLLPHLKYGSIPISYVRKPSSGEKPKFSILLPTWNNLAMLQLCVESIEKNSHFQHQIVIHVNDGSDGTKEWIEKKGLSYSYSKQNVGVCYAVNAAYTLAEADYIVYINDDMYAAPGWDLHLWREIEQLKTNKFFLSSTAIEPIDVGKKIAIAPHSFGRKTSEFNEAEFLASYASFSMDDWSGSSWPPCIVHRSMWDAVGGYSVEFSPGFYSDPDFAIKLWKNGVRIFKGVSQSRVYHFLESSTRRLKRNETKGANHLFLKKWNITARTFYKFYLRMGSKYAGELSEPKLTLSYLYKRTLCFFKKIFT